MLMLPIIGPFFPLSISLFFFFFTGKRVWFLTFNFALFVSFSEDRGLEGTGTGELRGNGRTAWEGKGEA